MSKQIDLRDCPNTRDYLENGLQTDLDALTVALPEVIMASDGSSYDLARVGIEISYVIEHLREVRDELMKGGAL